MNIRGKTDEMLKLLTKYEWMKKKQQYIKSDH